MDLGQCPNCRTNINHKLLFQLKKAVHQLRMRKEKTAKEVETIATVEKLIATLKV